MSLTLVLIYMIVGWFAGSVESEM